MSNLVDQAKRELIKAGLFDKESDYEGMLGDAVLELIKVFSKQGHSGMSASVVRRLFGLLADFKPLTPLSFESDQWNEVSNGQFQHRRDSKVFKEGQDGKPYYIGAFYMVTQNGGTWSGRVRFKDGRSLGRAYIKNPSKRLKTFQIAVVEYEVAPDNWEMWVEDTDQIALKELAEFYELEVISKEANHA